MIACSEADNGGKDFRAMRRAYADICQTLQEKLHVLENDPEFGLSSAKLLERLLLDGLCVSPVTMVELSAAFSGDLFEQKKFLDFAGISYSEPWTTSDMEASHLAWHTSVHARRARKTARSQWRIF